MSWRTYYWGLVMGSCLQSIWYVSASNDCLGWAVPFILAIGGGIIFGGKWLWKHTIYLDDNFRITIVNRLPPDFDKDPPSVRSVPLGGSDLLLAVHCRYKFKVKRVDFRILDDEYRPELAHVRGFPATVEITQLEDIYDGGLAISQGNGVGGMEGEYSIVRALSRNQALYFRMRIEARIVNYSGLISFRAQNEDGERSLARYAFLIDPHVPVSSIPMRPMPTLASLPPGWPAPPPEAL